MRDQALQVAGAIAVLVAIAHAIIGETKVFARAQIKPDSVRLLLRLVWHCGALAWVGFGVLLFAAPVVASVQARHWIVAMAVVVFSTAAAANAWATKGRHFGWMALLLVTGLALAGGA